MKYSLFFLVLLFAFSLSYADSSSVLEYYGEDELPVVIEKEYKKISIEISNNISNTYTILSQVKKVRDLHVYLLDSLVAFDSLITVLQKIDIQNLYIESNYSWTIPNFQKVSILVLSLKAPKYLTTKSSKFPFVKAFCIVKYGENAPACPFFGELLVQHSMFIKYDESNSNEQRIPEFAKKKIEVKKKQKIEVLVAEEIKGEKYEPNKQIVETVTEIEKKDNFLSSIIMKRKNTSTTLSHISQQDMSLKGFLTDSLVLFGYKAKTFDLSNIGEIKKLRFFGWSTYQSFICTEKNTTLSFLEINGTSLTSFPQQLHKLENLQELHIHNSLLNDITFDVSQFKKLGLLYITNSELTEQQIEELQKNCGSKGIICIVKDKERN